MMDDDELFTILLLSIPPFLRPDQNVFRAGLRAVYNAGRVSSAPSREAIAEAIYVADQLIPGSVFESSNVWIDNKDDYLAMADAVLALMKEN